MNFNFRHIVTLTNQTPLVNKPKKSSGLLIHKKSTLDDFYLTSKTQNPNYILISNNSIFSKNGDSVVIT